jgi:hypothetical protein
MKERDSRSRPLGSCGLFAFGFIKTECKRLNIAKGVDELSLAPAIACATFIPSAFAVLRYEPAAPK